MKSLFWLTQCTKDTCYPQDIGNESWNENNSNYSVAIFLLKRVHEGDVVLRPDRFDKEECTWGHTNRDVKTLKPCCVEIGILWVGAPYRVWVQQHCCKYKTQGCNDLSAVMSVRNELYLGVNMYVTLWSYPLTDVTQRSYKLWGVGEAVKETPVTLLQDTVSSKWLWSSYFKR